ncbi:MAG: outer membrane lipoprotein chaperone LolA [Thermodesulfobacteriota bacterium]
MRRYKRTIQRIANIKGFCLLFITFLSFLPSLLSAGELDEIVSSLQKTYKDIDAISAEFIAETSSKSLGNKISADGTVYFKKPGMMRWEYSTPPGDLIISDGRIVWFYQSDLNQVIESAVNRDARTISQNFLAGIGSLRDDFEIIREESRTEIYRLKLSPKIQQPGVDRLYIDVDKENFIVKGTTVIDPYGNETTVTFKKIKINRPIRDSLFRFTPPEGTSVVRPRQLTIDD